MSVGAVQPPRGLGEQWLESDGTHIDVRALSPPTPFVAIIRLIESLRDGGPVIVHHHRDPLPLYAELAERGWRAERIAGEAGEIRLRLSRDS